MKIKKPMKVKTPGGEGGAAIADRFKLDVTSAGSSKKVSSGKTLGTKAVAFAFAAGTLSLVMLGVLVFMMYKHSEYLMPV